MESSQLIIDYCYSVHEMKQTNKCSSSCSKNYSFLMVDGSHNTLKCIHVQSLGPNLVVMWTISCDKAPSFLKQFSDEFVSGRKLSPCMACPLGHQDSPVFRRNFTMPHFQVLFLLKPYLHHLSILSFHCLSKSCIHLLHLIGVVIWQQINYCVHFPACFIESLL